MSLNPRQAKFAELYHRYGNATRAYGEAYDAPKTETGSYPNWVSSDGNRLVRNEKVRAEIARLKGESAALSDMTREEMVDYLISAITTPIEQIGPESPLCEEYTVEDSGKIKVKSVSKLAALKELARITGVGEPQKLELSADDALAEIFKTVTGAKEK